MGKIIERGKARRKRQKKAETTKPQFYGGSKERGRELDARNEEQRAASEERVQQGLDTLSGERRLSLSRNRDMRGDVLAERGKYEDATGKLSSEAQARGEKYGEREDSYGMSADQSLGDYRGGRGAILGGADKLERND